MPAIAAAWGLLSFAPDGRMTALIHTYPSQAACEAARVRQAAPDHGHLRCARQVSPETLLRRKPVRPAISAPV
jgi:hypothetical protein